MIQYKGRKLRLWADMTLRLILSSIVILVCVFVGDEYRESLAEEFAQTHDLIVLPTYRLKSIDDLPEIDINLFEATLIDCDIEYEELIDKREEEHEQETSGIVYLGSFLLTGYCDCYECQEEWVGTTALGTPPIENWTIAVDPNVIPLGSYVWINNNRYYAQDVGGAINDYHIDIYMGSHYECYSDICNGYADVYLET